MTTVGIISDTHSYLDTAVFEYFKDCDEIWHAGDIGNLEVLEKLRDFKPLRAVYGNIDAKEIRWQVPENQHFVVEDFKIFITHIGGIPSSYNQRVRKLMRQESPQIFVCGHVHALMVMKDPKMPRLLFINPGAAGREGSHKVRTLLRLVLDAGKILKIEAIELGKR